MVASQQRALHWTKNETKVENVQQPVSEMPAQTFGFFFFFFLCPPAAPSKSCRIAVLVPGLLELHMHGRIHDPEMEPYPPRVTLDPYTAAILRSASGLSNTLVRL